MSVRVQVVIAPGVDALGCTSTGASFVVTATRGLAALFAGVVSEC